MGRRVPEGQPIELEDSQAAVSNLKTSRTIGGTIERHSHSICDPITFPLWKYNKVVSKRHLNRGRQTG